MVLHTKTWLQKGWQEEQIKNRPVTLLQIEPLWPCAFKDGEVKNPFYPYGDAKNWTRPLLSTTFIMNSMKKKFSAEWHKDKLTEMVLFMFNSGTLPQQVDMYIDFLKQALPPIIKRQTERLVGILDIVMMVRYITDQAINSNNERLSERATRSQAALASQTITATTLVSAMKFIGEQRTDVRFANFDYDRLSAILYQNFLHAMSLTIGFSSLLLPGEEEAFLKSEEFK